ncbi:MAG: anhydro-N-acetylmuramic acid kinase [Chitinophagaceae bacterium]
MTYRAIGIMSGSSLDGLDICFAELDESGGKWTYEILASECMSYSGAWVEKLRNAIHLSGREYMRLHTAYGHYIGEQVNAFIGKYNLHHRVQLIASHGHTTFHEPQHKMTGQIGDGAAIAATTGINVVSDLRAMDLALGGQGAPIVPIGEKLLLGDHRYFLNLGGIANISANLPGNYVAFDVCPANRVLNMLVREMGHDYDEGGAIAATGNVDAVLLEQLNGLDFYKQAYPKSLANDFGTDIVYPMIQTAGLSVPDALRTCVEHVAIQIKNAVESLAGPEKNIGPSSMLVCGGGTLNDFQVERLTALLASMDVQVAVPDKTLIEFKEALVMALIGVLRWREENNVLNTVTGASRSSIGGAVWVGQEA